jgi:hypothetical protein
MKSRAVRATGCAALMALSMVVGAGAAQAAPGKDGRPDKPQQQGKPQDSGKPAKPGGDDKPGKPAKPAKGESTGESGPMQVVFSCSYECLADGTCAWVMRAEKRPLPVPVKPR